MWQINIMPWLKPSKMDGVDLIDFINFIFFQNSFIMPHDKSQLGHQIWTIEIINSIKQWFIYYLFSKFQNALFVPCGNKGLVTILITIFGK
jgi:hypothetical protein